MCEDPLLLVPAGLFPSIQVRLLEQFSKEPAVWQGGIKVCSRSGAQARVVHSQDGRSIRIHVRAPCAREGRVVLRLVEVTVRTAIREHEGLCMVRSLCRGQSLRDYDESPASVHFHQIVGKSLHSWYGDDTVAMLLGFDQGD
jgi:hypothetical protein